MYVSQIGAVVVIDTNTNTAGSPIPGADVKDGIAYEPVNGRMYGANDGSDSVSVIQTPNSSVNSDSVPQAISLPH